MRKSSKSFNIIASLLAVSVVMTIAAIAGDYYFDLNDDVLMKDILSGAYTGVPEGHNIQMLYPIGAFIAMFYRVIRTADWYGIFLCLCQYLCVFVIALKVASYGESKALSAAGALGASAFFIGAAGAHFVFVQYTFTCGMLSAAAAFLILTHGKKDKNLLIAAAFVFAAYLLRSEMLLLMLPMLGLSVLIKWVLTKKDFFVYLSFCIILLVLLAAGSAANKLAYSSPGWEEFGRLFDARTELYDFQYIPDYDENRDFYDSIGLSRSEQQLLINYNFGIDDEINADTLNAVAEYAAGLRTDEVPLPKQIKNALPPYFYRLSHAAFQKGYEYPMTDFPWNLIVIVMYAGVLFSYIFPRRDLKTKKAAAACACLALLFACRSVLWLFIIVRGRDPIRITHPLYLIEIVILLGMLVLEENENKKARAAALIAALAISVISVFNQLGVIEGEIEAREKMREHYDELYTYFDNNQDSFYFIDVYTSVSCGQGMSDGEATFSEKMFENVDNSRSNHDLMGGWASKSPIFYDKLERAGLTSIQEALLKDNVYFVQNKAESTGWITDYYSEKGIEVAVEETDIVADVFGIYSIAEK